jgi:glutamate 5-kinase
MVHDDPNFPDSNVHICSQELSHYNLRLARSYAAATMSHMNFAQVVNLKKSGAKILIFIDESGIFDRRQLDPVCTTGVPAHVIAVEAAIGQANIARTFESFFSEHGIISAQLIVEMAHIYYKIHISNLVNTINLLLDHDAIPIVMESFLQNPIKEGQFRDLYDAVMNALVDR